MRSLPNILLVLSLPVGALVYAATVRVLEALLPGQGILTLFVPLFVAGLVMLPFLVPFFDRMARRDLADHARSQEAATKAGADSPDGRNESADPDRPDEGNETGAPEAPDERRV